MPTNHPGLGQPDAEALVTCPYNSSHRVALKRMQFHVTKCRKGHPGEKKECLYNATHMVNEQEYQFHLQTCPDRGVIDKYIYTAETQPVHVIESLPEPEVPPSEENWDDEHCETYNPNTKTLESEVIHVLIGATPSEKKKHKQLQRQKFRALEESCSTSSQAPEAVGEAKPKIDYNQPLRAPNTVGMHLKQSAEFEASNQPAVSAVATSSSSDDDQIPNLVPSNQWEGHRPGRAQSGSDGFTVFRSRAHRSGK